MSGFEDYTAQLDVFLKRYYRNRAFKGLLVFFVLFLGLVLVLGIVQRITFSSGTVRAVLFYASMGILLAVACVFIFFPLLQSKGWAKRMSRMQAAHYLAGRFPD